MQLSNVVDRHPFAYSTTSSWFLRKQTVGWRSRRRIKLTGFNQSVLASHGTVSLPCSMSAEALNHSTCFCQFAAVSWMIPFALKTMASSCHSSTASAQSRSSTSPRRSSVNSLGNMSWETCWEKAAMGKSKRFWTLRPCAEELSRFWRRGNWEGFQMVNKMWKGTDIFLKNNHWQFYNNLICTLKCFILCFIGKSNCCSNWIIRMSYVCLKWCTTRKSRKCISFWNIVCLACKSCLTAAPWRSFPFGRLTGNNNTAWRSS